MARVSTQDGPKSETLDQAFNAASPAPSSNLPNVQPHGFESTTKIRPSQSGFDDSFASGKPASPAPPPPPAGAAKHNPYARKRGAMPDAQPNLPSQINVPEHARRGRRRPQPAAQPQASAPARRFDDDDADDDFAALASSRVTGGASAEPEVVPQPEPESAPEPEAAAEPEPEAAPGDENGDDSDSDNDVDDLINDLTDNIETAEAGGDANADIPPEEMPLVKLCQHVWSLSTPDDEGCLDGGQMRNLMVMSGLDNAMLGTIWTMVDSEQRGKIDYRQLGFVLGLMGQAQAGEELDPSQVGPATQPPTLEGLKPME